MNTLKVIVQGIAHTLFFLVSGILALAILGAVCGIPVYTAKVIIGAAE